MNLNLIRSGLILILLALLSGLCIPLMAIARLGLAAHSIGIISGLLLMVLGGIWQVFSLPDHLRKLHSLLWQYSSYANWAGCLLAAALGSGTMTPVAAGGVTGAPELERMVALVLGSVVLTSLAAVLLSLRGLRRAPKDAAQSEITEMQGY